MKKLTAKNRAKIYLKASQLINEDVCFACWALLLAKIGKTGKKDLPDGQFNQQEILKDFPEFLLLEPTQDDYFNDVNLTGDVWFEDYNNEKNGLNVRRIALLLAYNMALDKQD